MSEDSTTITVNVPVALKKAVDAYIESRGMTLTGAVRAALHQLIAPNLGPAQELPGFRPELTALLEGSEVRRVLLLLTADSSGNRFYIEGDIDRNNSGDAIITLWQPGDETSRLAILRRDIVAWFPGGRAASELCAALRQRGWRDFSKPW